MNINYRYRAQELIYILENSDSEAVAYSAEFRDQVEQIRPMPKGEVWIEVGDAPARISRFLTKRSPLKAMAPRSILSATQTISFLFIPAAPPACPRA